MIDNHTSCDSNISDPVDHNKRASAFIGSTTIETNGLVQDNINAPNLVEFQSRSGATMHRIHVNLITKG